MSFFPLRKVEIKIRGFKSRAGYNGACTVYVLGEAAWNRIKDAFM